MYMIGVAHHMDSTRLIVVEKDSHVKKGIFLEYFFTERDLR